MTPLEPRIGEDGAAFYAGEIIGGELQLLDAQDAPQDLRGRSFAASIYGPDISPRVAAAAMAAMRAGHSRPR